MEKDNNTEVTRREFLAWAAAVAGMLMLPGCDPASQVAATSAVPAPAPTRNAVAYAAPATPQYAYVVPQPVPAPAPVMAPMPAASGRLSAMSRTSWGASPALPAKMRAMNGVSRITIHHEGSAKPNTDATPAQVAATLRLIQSQHRKRMSAGDIGYHFIIDRSGTIWQGRDWSFQGAHTSGANTNNLGVMLLGNFEIQQPTPQQVQALRLLTAALVRKYGLNPRRDLYCHNDFGNTQCPGRHLKPHVLAMRRGQ